MNMHQNKTYQHQENVYPLIPEGDFYFQKGVEAFQKRNFEGAIKWLRKAIEMVPADPLYQCQMSIIYTEIGAYHTANQLLTKVLESSGSDYTDCYYLLANNYAHLGLLNDAKKYANSYLEKEPDGEFHEAAEQLIEMVDIDIDDDWLTDEEDEFLIYQETVFYHLENDDWDKALPLLEEMTTLFPGHPLVSHDYSQALFYSGYQDEAVTMETDKLEQDPNSLYSHINLAIFSYELGNITKYESHIQALKNVYPLHEQLRLRIAITFAQTEMYQEAYSRFRGLAKSTAKNYLSYYKYYSISAYRIGEPSKALSLWEEGCKRHPGLSKQDGPWV
ncbi:tetratricopeptide repeat protein [Virgibacillus siamensis]